MLYSCFRYTGRLFPGCVLFVTHCNIFRASWETKKKRLSNAKKYIEEFALLSMSLFAACFIIKIHNIAMGSILCGDIMSEGSKI